MNKRSTALRKLAAAPHILWAMLFIIAPLLFVCYYAFTDKNGAFSMANFAQMLDPNYVQVFVRSVSFAIIATFICFLIAYPLAYFISQMKVNVQGMLIMLVMLPMWMNLLIRTYSWMTILEDTGVINSILSYLGIEPLKMINTPAAVILGMVYNYLPYMVMPIYSAMTKIDRSHIEAARDLGCNSMGVITKVVFPLSISGIISGITMVFVPSISTFYISQKLGGGNFDLVGDTIERQFQVAYNYNLGAAMSLVLMILILICMAVMNKFGNDEDEVMI